MRKLLFVLGTIVLSVGAALAGGSASAAVVKCKTVVYRNGPVYVTSASGLSCAAAAREQRRMAWSGKNRFTTPGGFRCRPSGRGSVGYQIRCTKGAKAYRLEFAD